jgi:hypothetical protein
MDCDSSQEAIAMAKSSGGAAILLNGRSVVVSESTITLLLARQTAFAFLSMQDGIISTVPMN